GASAMNIATKGLARARCGRMRLMHTSFSNPAAPLSRARKISAMPPVARRATRLYLPNRTASVAAGADPTARAKPQLQTDPVVVLDHENNLVRGRSAAA